MLTPVTSSRHPDCFQLQNEMSTKPAESSTDASDLPSFCNISAYKFVPVDNIAELKASWLPICKAKGLKGTILLSSEGINMFLAGDEREIDSLLELIQRDSRFANLPVKKSFSDYQPFNRMLIRLKKEIISMGVEEIQPSAKTSPKISATQLKQWLDEGKELTLLDVRNDYEIEIGTFDEAVDLDIDHFREFPAAMKKLDDAAKEKPVVMFCTGGIRCEKAGPLMQQQGFEEVYQLDGGILRYFEEVGGAHYDGECFVFDQRVAVDPQLKETPTTQCYACQAVITETDQQSDLYDPPHACPNCFRKEDEKLGGLLDSRATQLQDATSQLPGSIPYNNVRPVNVPLRHDNQTCLEMFEQMHSHVESGYWKSEFENGLIHYKDKPIAARFPVCAEQACAFADACWRSLQPQHAQLVYGACLQGLSTTDRSST